MLFDESGLISEGVRVILNETGRYDLVKSWNIKTGAVKLYKKHFPDLVIVELLIENSLWIDVIKEIKEIDPLAKILIFTFLSDEKILERVLEMGVQGYLLKKNHSKLIYSIDKIRSGVLYIDKGVINEKEGINDKIKNITNLPKRELEVLTLIANGMSVKAIAEKIGVKIKTIYNTRSRLKSRLGAKTQGELSNIARAWLKEVIK